MRREKKSTYPLLISQLFPNFVLVQDMLVLHNDKQVESTLLQKNMKLAEALSIRADLQRKVSQLKGRLKDSSKVQEGDTPAEQVTDLFQELEECLAQLEEMVYRINRTNMETVHEGETITRMIARKDRLAQRVAINQDLLAHVMETDRYGRNEIKYVRMVDVAALRKETDGIAKALRELDLKLQELNWTIDLL